MAQTLVNRKFTTQSYGTEAGTAGGSFMRRPYGPSLAGWTDGQGWSAFNDTGNNRRLVLQAINIGSSNSFLVSVWYKFSKSEGTGALLWLMYGLAAGAYAPYIIKIHPDTLVIDLIGDGTHGTTQLAVGTLDRYRDVNLTFGGWRSGPGVAGTCRLLRKYRGQNAVQLGTDASFQINADFFTEVDFGTYAGDGGAAAMSARIGLPSAYTLDGVADIVYPSEIIEPTGANDWHVSSGAAGGGKGYSAAEAFTPAELTTYAAEPFTLMGGELLDASGNVVDATVLNKTTIRVGVKAGTYRYGGERGGPVIYGNDSAGPIRFPAPLALGSNDYGSFKPNPSLGGRKIDVRGATRVTGWILHAGNVWKKVLTNTYAVVFEYDSTAEADSITGKPRWLAHPTAANLAAYLAAATAGSFWTDGTTVYLWPTGSGDPNANGKVYEVTGGDNTIVVSCRGFLLQDLVIQNCASVDFFTNTSPTLSTGDCVKFDGDGACIANRCDMLRGGRHIWATADGFVAAHQRSILIDCTLNDMRPAAYGTGGGQTLLVWNGNTTNGVDNQWSLDNTTCTTTQGVVGSTAGTIGGDAVLDEHNGGTTAYVFTEGEIVNGCNFPGANLVGHATTAMTIDNSTIGSAGFDIAFGAKNVTITRSRIIGRNFPVIGAGVNPGAGTHTIKNNILVSSGAISTTATIIGTATVSGNTIDATAATGGTTKALWTRGGVLSMTFGGNDVLFNSADAFRLFDTITPASGDVLAMAYNQLQNTPADGTRILVTAYAGAVTKTLAQLQAGGQDVGSVWTTDVKADSATYRIGSSSPARGFVPLASVPSLAGTTDFAGRTRAPSGFTDAGALLFAGNRRRRDNNFHARNRRRMAARRR